MLRCADMRLWLSLATFFAAFSVIGQGFVKVEQIPMSSSAVINRAVVLDETVFLAGYFEGSVVFGETTLTSASINSFVAKYDRTSGFQWAKQGGGDLTDSATDLAVDKEGNSYVVGSFQGTATFDAFSVSTLPSAFFGGSSLFLAKYSSDGQLLWVR